VGILDFGLDTDSYGDRDDAWNCCITPVARVIRAERLKGLQWSAFSEEPAGALALNNPPDRHPDG
jgi:hypothetical protein